MGKKLEAPDAGSWVDIYTEKCFQGRLVRLRAESVKHASVFKRKAFKRIGSVIVSPKAIAEFTRRGDSGCTRLPQRTVLDDASYLANGKGLQSIRVAPAIE